MINTKLFEKELIRVIANHGTYDVFENEQVCHALNLLVSKIQSTVVLQDKQRENRNVDHPL
jgi:hypothetical protein